MAESKRTRKVNRASFGSVRKLPSGRWQARYPDEAGRPMNAPHTFETKQSALDYLASVRTDRNRGSYIDHRDGAQPFGPYARAWIDTGGSRGKLAPRTAELYRDILDRQLVRFDAMPVSSITAKTVRDWYAATRRTLAAAAKKRGGTGETRLRQSYALLRSILGTAVRDRLIASNPCGIVGAGVATSPERPYLAPDQLAAIVAALPAQYVTPLRLMFAAHLRLGELVALERGDYDADRLTLRVERQAVTTGGRTITTPTKTGTARSVALPPSTAAMLSEHLTGSTGFPRSPMFVRRDGAAITRNGLQQAWAKATKALGLQEYHLHDVRHAGLTLAAQAGATTRELMARGGHRSSRAALIYQHAAEERMTVLAGRMDALLGGATGTQMARTDEIGTPSAPVDGRGIGA